MADLKQGIVNKAYDGNSDNIMESTENKRSNSQNEGNLFERETQTKDELFRNKEEEETIVVLKDEINACCLQQFVDKNSVVEFKKNIENKAVQDSRIAKEFNKNIVNDKVNVDFNVDADDKVSNVKKIEADNTEEVSKENTVIELKQEIHNIDVKIPLKKVVKDDEKLVQNEKVTGIIESQWGKGFDTVTIVYKLEKDKIETITRNSSINGDDRILEGKDLCSNIGESPSGLAEEEFRYKFTGPVFRSFNEKIQKQSWDRTSLRSMKHLNKLKESVPELNRSQYSLVSCGELTAEAVQLWLSLPEEVKYDPALAPFRQLYEKEHGKDSKRSTSAPKRLPLVNSAPHLNNNLHVLAEDVFSSQKALDGQFGNGNTMGIDVACQKKESKITQARHYIKMTALLACWLFFTLVFLMYNEKEHVLRHASLAPGEVKNYTLNVPDDKLSSVSVRLSGPFLSENNEARMNNSQLENANKMDVWLEKWILGDRDDILKVEKGVLWTLILENETQLDFNEGEHRSYRLRFSTDGNQTLTRNRRSTEQPENNQTEINTAATKTRSNNSESRLRSRFAIVMKTNAQKITPFTISYTLNPLEISEGVIYAALLLCGLYILIIFEVINRTMAAILLSTTSLATLALAGERPSVEEVISWLDVETLLLLFSMMLLVAIMAETGMFDYLAVYTFEVTKGKLWPLITLLSAITALLSTFLDNVTTVLLMTPVTIRLCEVMDLDPIPILMSMVLFSNIGGTATPVGDPPNVIIASNKAVVQAGINFTNFTLHMSLGIILVAIQTYFQLRFMFRDTSKLRQNVPRDIQELRHQISIWRRAADSLPHLSKDQLIVRERLERKVRKLQVQLDAMVKESSKRACPKDTFQSTLDELKGKYKIRDKALLIKSTVAISFVVAVFFLHSIPELNRVSLGWTALLGAILLLLLADREDLEPILHRVEWSTLLFFAALFVLMEALSKLGLIEFIGSITEGLILSVHENARLAVALLLLLWVSGVTSAFVDNIPLTTMMVRVVTSLGSKPNLNLPMAPLIWALSFGACLGGNGTLIGASANVVCAGVAEQHGYKFTFMQFFKIGFPVMIGHLMVASVYLLVCHCAFTWH